jgi:Carbohydrate-selective porin, OprB family/S-layer homology domain
MNRRSRLSWLLKSTAICVLASIPLAAKAAEPSDKVSVDSVPGTMPSLISDVNDAEQSADQVTSVSQLSDVQPTDWAFQALQSLVERYGCIAGYPDGTFRGNRAATRYELAAALNACLDQISDRFATKEDLETVKALQEEFKAELATLKGRVDGLEARTATLEAQQFSTTTKLSGEVVMIGAEAFTTDDKKVVATGTPTVPLNARFFSGYRVRLNFDTSFTGEDRLRVRLQARDTANLNSNTIDGVVVPTTGTNMGRLGFDGSTGGNFELDDLWYKFPIGKKTKVTVIAKSGEFNDFVGDTFNPYLSSSATGALSRFGRFNPIYRFGDSSNSAGVVANYKFNDQFAASIGYLAAAPTNSVGPTGGLFGGTYSVLAQLEVKPTKDLGLGLTYVHSFEEANNVNGVQTANSLTGGTGSGLGGQPFGNNPMSSNSVGVEANWKAAKWVNFSGWAGASFAERSNGANASATVANWAIAAAFPDLFMEGNLGALIVGQEPTLIGGSIKPTCSGAVQGAECGRNFHLEALYKIKVNGNISVTPGLIVILNPQNNENNGTEFVPVIRSTFTF